jgi:hypothetical protein
MVERKVSKEKYIFAFLVTAGIFALGLLLGLVIEQKRIDYVQFKDQQQTLSFNSLQLQYQFVDQFALNKNCDALSTTFEDNIRSLETTRGRIENYQRESTIKTEDFELLQREYMLAQIRYWLLAKQTKDICGSEFSTVLYFFADEEDCPQCNEQSFVLTYLKQKLGMNLLNFAFDGEYEAEPMVPLLKKVYGIEEYPAIVINGKTYNGFVDVKTVLKDICPTYKEVSIDLCENYKNAPT